MERNQIYEDIACRTGGDIYIGVVGPVRTGKSTFIKRFMETQVIPSGAGGDILIDTGIHSIPSFFRDRKSVV